MINTINVANAIAKDNASYVDIRYHPLSEKGGLTVPRQPNNIITLFSNFTHEKTALEGIFSKYCTITREWHMPFFFIPRLKFLSNKPIIRNRWKLKIAMTCEC